MASVYRPRSSKPVATVWTDALCHTANGPLCFLYSSLCTHCAPLKGPLLTFVPILWLLHSLCPEHSPWCSPVTSTLFHLSLAFCLILNSPLPKMPPTEPLALPNEYSRQPCNLTSFYRIPLAQFTLGKLWKLRESKLHVRLHKSAKAFSTS